MARIAQFALHKYRRPLKDRGNIGDTVGEVEGGSEWREIGAVVGIFGEGVGRIGRFSER